MMEICAQYEPPTTNIRFDEKNKFHVFLSFRGADVRKNLVDHLYESLTVAELRVFLDSEELEKGTDIDSNLKIAIERSDILIPIFSKRYAESTWCLEEAARMRRSNGLIIPLFYDVQPSDVRYPEKEKSPYAKAFVKHYNHLDRHDENTIEECKDALHQISSLSGWTMEAEFGYEGRLVKTVVRHVLNTLKNVPLEVAMHPVGLQRSKNELLDNLNLSSTDTMVRVGISGIGGVGKTTLVKAVYNEIHCGFDASCIVLNIAATAHNNTRLTDLQGRILRSLVNYQGEVSSVDQGKVLMRDRLRGVRALVILDDVDDRNQLHAVDGDWFGHGSRVIITSRDKHILNLAKVDSIHEMNGLGEDESLQLFSWHAFCRAFPTTSYEEVSIRIAKACRGHPLSLEVIGAHLYDKKAPNDIPCWEEALLNIGESPDVSRVLRISYDGLSHVEKAIFLDIAYHFVGEKKRDAVIFWEVLYPSKVQTAIKNLLLKMLINISGPQDLLDMHDLMRDMGRGIQMQTHNKHSRMCLPMDACKALGRDKAEEVNMLSYTGENGREPVSLHSMPSLRYLFLQNTKVVGNIGHRAPNLIWIRIRNCEFVSDRHTWLILSDKLQFDGSWSQVRILSLEECVTLTRIPSNLDSLVNLQCLYLQDCKGLTSLPPTVGNLSQLKQFDLHGCASLTSLPDTVGSLVQLKELYLGGCEDLQSLPNTVGNLAQLQVLNLYGCTSLRVLPNTVGNLAQLRVLNLHACAGLQSLPYSVGKLAQLRMLNFHGCSGLGSFHDMVAKLAQRRELNRSAGLGSLVEKKFNIYLGFRAVEVRETLVDHLYRSLSTRSLRICRGREDDQSRDIKWSFTGAIDNSDILVPVFSKGFAKSRMCLRKTVAMCRSNGLIIPFFHDVEPLHVEYPEREGSPYAQEFKDLYSEARSDAKYDIERYREALRQIGSGSGIKEGMFYR